MEGSVEVRMGEVVGPGEGVKGRECGRRMTQFKQEIYIN